ncbi:MAG: hypothetical protein [Siphoviridae sp. ctpQM7]|nr:MAG: hypothetical protein [Siphoviridae sp. ctpQM7]
MNIEDTKPSADIPALVRKLMKMEKHVTGGKWEAVVPHQEVARFPYDHHQEESYAVMVKSDQCKIHAIVDCSCNHTCVELLEQEDNAKFIAAIRNAFPAIASAFLAQEQQIAEWRGVLEDIVSVECDGFEYGWAGQEAEAALSKYPVPPPQ